MPTDSYESFARVRSELDQTPISSSETSRVFTLIRWDWFGLILPVVAISPLLVLQSWFLWEKEHLQFFPLAFAAVVWFLWNEGHGDKEISVCRRRYLLALCGLVFGNIVSIGSLVTVSPWLAQFSLVLLIFFWAYGRFGNMSLLRVAGICGLIAVTIPPPFGLDQSLVRFLQSLSSNFCSDLMDVFQITHVKRGNIIEIASKPLFVEEACSGVDSQYALMAVAGVLLLLGNTKLIVSLITIVTVPIWAILGNLLRILSIVVGLEFFGIDLSKGMAHTVLGLVVFMIAAWAHWSSVQLLVYIQESFLPHSQISPVSIPDRTTNRSNASTESFNLSWAWAILPCCALLLMPAGGLGLFNHLRTRMPFISQEVADQFPGKGDLPVRLMDQTMVDYRTESRKERNLFGQHSHTWFYQGNLGSQSASLDFVFREFHPLWICYAAAGWEERGIKRITIDNLGNQENWPYYEILLENKQSEYASVYFGFFDENGNPFDYDHTTIIGEEFQRPRTFLDVIKPPRDLGNPLLFQFQLLTTTNEPLTEEQLTSHRQQFKSLRDRIHSATSSILSSIKLLN